MVPPLQIAHLVEKMKKRALKRRNIANLRATID
jgi:hypothetical protein